MEDTFTGLNFAKIMLAGHVAAFVTNHCASNQNEAAGR